MSEEVGCSDPRSWNKDKYAREFQDFIDSGGLSDMEEEDEDEEEIKVDAKKIMQLDDPEFDKKCNIDSEVRKITGDTIKDGVASPLGTSVVYNQITLTKIKRNEIPKPSMELDDKAEPVDPNLRQKVNESLAPNAEKNEENRIMIEKYLNTLMAYFGLDQEEITKLAARNSDLQETLEEYEHGLVSAIRVINECYKHIPNIKSEIDKNNHHMVRLKSIAPRIHASYYKYKGEYTNKYKKK